MEKKSPSKILPKMRSILLILALSCGLASCAQMQKMGKKSDVLDTPDTLANLELVKSDFGSLPNWEQDNLKGVIPALKSSCDSLAKQKKSATSLWPEATISTPEQWLLPCKKLNDLVKGLPSDKPPTTAMVRTFLQDTFTPWWAVNTNGEDGRTALGLFTGYYEPEIYASRIRHGNYTVPIYDKPKDLVEIELGDFRPDLKGRRLSGRLQDGHLKPYPDRAAIDAKPLSPEVATVIAWARDDVDVFFLHIQGSGMLLIDNADELAKTPENLKQTKTQDFTKNPNYELNYRQLRVGYSAQNGQPYYAIGRTLIKQGDLKPEDVSLQAIREWIDTNPDKAKALLHSNPSYIFFSVKSLQNSQKLGSNAIDVGAGLLPTGPDGATGVPLTPERSLAIDDAILPYHLPLWLVASPPMPDEPAIARILVGQDTGGAIIGTIRGDVFWGRSPRAEYLAGHMKSTGSYAVFLPKGVVPAPAYLGDKLPEDLYNPE